MVEATMLGLKTKSGLKPNCRKSTGLYTVESRLLNKPETQEKWYNKKVKHKR
jgi:hypothetical protein